MTKTLTYIGTGIISQGLNLLPNTVYEVSDKAYTYFLETFPLDFLEFTTIDLDNKLLPEDAVIVPEDDVTTTSKKPRVTKTKVAVN